MTENRRARKKRATLDALRRCALHLVDTHGLEHVTVEMIAEAADVSPRTFFNHFPTKEDALVGPDPDAVAEVERFCAAQPPGMSALTVLRGLALARCALFTGDTDEMELRMRVMAANPVLYDRFHASFHDIERVLRLEIARRDGVDPELDLYPRLLAAVGGAVIRTSVDLWLAGRSRPLAGIVDEAFDLCTAGLDVVPAAPVAAPPRRRRPAVVAAST